MWRAHGPTLSALGLGRQDRAGPPISGKHGPVGNATLVAGVPRLPKLDPVDSHAERPSNEPYGASSDIYTPVVFVVARALDRLV